jgi:hypothetical protein
VTASQLDDFAVFRAACAPITPKTRARIHHAACGVVVLAMLDAIAGATGATTDAVRAALREPDTLAVVLEDVCARDAHAIVHGLIHAGLIDTDAARVAHCRIDRRCNPDGRSADIR